MPADLELNGTWHYSGAYPDYSSVLVVDNTSASEAGFWQGTSFDNEFEILEYDNDTNQVMLQATKIVGPSEVSEGGIVYYTYSVSGRTARLRYAAEGYPLSANGEEGDDMWTYQRE